MLEIKTVLNIAALLLVARGFCTYQVKLEKKSETIAKSKVEVLAKKSTKYCLNDGECYCLDDEDIVSCNCTWLYGGKRCEKYMWWV